jgi:hypothetical protein
MGMPTVDQKIDPQNRQIRSFALKYLIENMRDKYTDYSCDDYQNIAFIPALDDSKACLGTPYQVFSKPEWSQLGFLVVHPSIQADVVKLQIKEHPTTNQLVDLLQRTRPTDPEKAKKWFSILSVRVSGKKDYYRVGTEFDHI